MTICSGISAIVFVMKSHRLTFLLLLLAQMLTPVNAEEKTLREELRDALYTEEVTREPAAAAVAYETLLMRYDLQKQVAASALFRLAELRHNQGRKEDAIAHYQRLVLEFPNATAEKNRALERLNALGVKQPKGADGVGAVAVDKEEEHLLELKKFRDNNPDLITEDILLRAIKNDWQKCVKWIIEESQQNLDYSKVIIAAADECKPNILRYLIAKLGETTKEQFAEAMSIACDQGYLEIVKILLESKVRSNTDFGDAFIIAVERSRVNIVRHLIESIGDSLKEKFPEALSIACKGGNVEIVKILLAAGANPNTGITRFLRNNGEGGHASLMESGLPLIVSLYHGHTAIADLLIDAKADINFLEVVTQGQITPLAALILCGNHKAEYLKKFLSKGANINTELKVEIPADYSNITEVFSYLGLAILTGQAELASTLFAHGAKLDGLGKYAKSNDKDYLYDDDYISSSYTSFGRSVSDKQKLECIKVLVANGCKLSVKGCKRLFRQQAGNSGDSITRYLKETFPEVFAQVTEPGGQEPMIRTPRPRIVPPTIPNHE